MNQPDGHGHPHWRVAGKTVRNGRQEEIPLVRKESMPILAEPAEDRSSRMTVRPIGPRIYVTPDPKPTQTASGLLIPNAATIPEMSGVVVAIGTGPASHSSLIRARATAIKDCIDVVQQYEQTFQYPATLQLVREEFARILRTVPAATHLVTVGQRVVFPHNKGYELVLNEDTDDRILVLNEDDVIGVVCEVDAVVAV